LTSASLFFLNAYYTYFFVFFVGEHSLSLARAHRKLAGEKKTSPLLSRSGDPNEKQTISDDSLCVKKFCVWA